MKTIDIAMATYNGEKFIEEQILSIQNQTYHNWILYISDDGSTDSTVDHIKEMVKKDQRIRLINTQRQGGVIPNFNKALEFTNAEYVVFCDQDDLWPKDRLETLFKKISLLEVGCDKPIMLFTDLRLVDEKGEGIADSFYKNNSLNPYSNMIEYRLLWDCTIYGCSTIVNRALIEKSFPVPNSALMHDQWFAIIANKSNGLFFDEYVSVYYRQHTNNVVGGGGSSVFSKLKRFNKNINNIKKNSIKIKMNLYGNNKGLYDQNNNLISYFDFMRFAVNEVLPGVFRGQRKLYAFFLFLGFLFLK